MRLFILYMLFAVVGWSATPVMGAVPTNVAVSLQVREYLNHRVDQACRGRLVEVTRYGFDRPAPDAPADPPLLYWRIKVKIEDQYTGWRWPWSRHVTLTTLVPPPIDRPGELVLAYGTKTRSDRNRLWGNVYQMRVLPNRSFAVDSSSNIICAPTAH